MKNYKAKFIYLLIITAAMLSFGIFVGPDLSLDAHPASDLIMKVRMPRALMALMAGGTFALCGAVFQSLFRNPIASPFTLGTAGGASFGVTVFISFFTAGGIFGIAMSSVFAFSGALLSVIFIYTAISGKKKFNPNSLILAGVIINFFFSGLILFLQYLTDQASAVRITRWTMGSLDVVRFDSLYFTAAVFLLGSLMIYRLRDELNLLSLGEEISVSRGVDVKRTGKNIFIISSLMISSVVAVTGPIGFVGIIAPHIASAYFGKNYRVLLPASLLTGSALLLFCDFISRSILWPVEIPVGIITALIGAVFIIKIIRGKN
jgi:iron complex transport system permease protein